MNRLHQRVGAQVLVYIGRTAHDAQESPGDEWLQRGNQELHQVAIHRVHFQDNHLVLSKQLVQYSQGCRGCDVARTQHQRQLSLFMQGVGRVIQTRRMLRQGAPGDTGLHPHVHTHTAEQQVVPQRMRQHPGADLAIGQFPHG